MKAIDYDTAIAVAADLVGDRDYSSTEYQRGMFELIGDMFPRGAIELDVRAREVELDVMSVEES